MAPRVRTITFTEDGGLAIEWVDPAVDHLASGLVVNHQVWLPSEAYDEEIHAVRRTVKNALQRALSDIAEAPRPAIPSYAGGEDDEDTPGPYEYPPGGSPEAAQRDVDQVREALDAAASRDRSADPCVEGKPYPAGGKLSACVTHNEPWDACPHRVPPPPEDARGDVAP